MLIFQGKDISTRWGELPMFVATNPEPKSWLDRAKSIAENSSYGIPYSDWLGYACDYWIIDYFKAWMPRTKLLQSKSKQSRMIRVVFKN